MIDYFKTLFVTLLSGSLAIILVLAITRNGTYEEGVELSRSLAIAAPLFIFISMQQAEYILAGKIIASECLKYRRNIIFSVIAVSATIGWFNGALTLSAFVIYKCADYLFEPIYIEGVKDKKIDKIFKMALLRFLCILFVIFIVCKLTIPASLKILIVGISDLAYVNILVNGYVTAKTKALKINVNDFNLSIGAVLAVISANLPRLVENQGNDGDQAFYSAMLSIIFGATLLFNVVNNRFVSVITGDINRQGKLKKFIGGSLFFFTAYMFCLLFMKGDLFIGNVFVEYLFGQKYAAYSGSLSLFAMYFGVLYWQAVVNCCLAIESAKIIYVLYNALFFILCFVAVSNFDYNVNKILKVVIVCNSVALVWPTIFIIKNTVRIDSISIDRYSS